MHELSVIGGYLSKMLLPALAGGGFSLLSLPVRRKFHGRRGECSTPHHEGCLFLFVAYLCGLFSLIVLPSGRTGGGLHYNLVPFQIFVDVAEELSVGNFLGLMVSLLGNIAMFIPLGFFPALLWRGPTLKRALLIGVCTSFSIELCQLPLGRSADVDDLWLNTLGTGLGFGLSRLFCLRFPRWCNHCKVISKTEEETLHGR